MTPAALVAARDACIDAGTIRVRGWLAPPWGVGGLSNNIEPAWLGEWATMRVLWTKPLPSAGCLAATDCVWEWIHVAPGTGVAITAPDRWVEVTGHYSDPASASCHVVGDNVALIADPVAYCRRMFVATAVTDVPAPG
jgi:hypothetical protein